MQDYRITIHGVGNSGEALPVSGGVPLSQGALSPEAALVLEGDAGCFPVQSRSLATWADGTPRWLFLDTVAPIGEYVLKVGEGGASTSAVSSGEGIANEIFSLRQDGDDLLCGDRVRISFSAVDGAGRVFIARPETVEVEESGPIRSTLRWAGALRDGDGRRLLSFRLRASLYAGSSRVLLQPMLVVDPESGVICNLRELSMRVEDSGAESAFIGGAPGWEGAVSAEMRLFQKDDETYELGEEKGGKAPGWAELRGTGDFAIALRDFWEQWPKSLEVKDNALHLGLLPAFEEGDFEQMQPDYKHQWFFKGQTYQLRTGQARSWDIWLDLAGGGAALADFAGTPPRLVPASGKAIATGAWGDIQAAGDAAMKDYDPWAEQLFHCYRHSVEVQRDYGAMNWGDWFGERKINWGNHEYDTTNQLLLQFARTGDPEYLRWAEAAGRHSAEVDTVHFLNGELKEYFKAWEPKTYPSRPGLVHQHTHGHVGGFTDEETVRDWLRAHGIGKHTSRPYTCLDPFNLGHVWTTGMTRLYFLTGNPFLKETVEVVADNLAQLVEDREYRFMGSTHCGRLTGWTLLALGGAYELNQSPRYLAAMKLLAEDALELQDPVCGGWIIHPMAPDHCICKNERHTGMATFITAVLINGLSRYYELSGDERMPHCIDEAVTYVNNDTWRENLRGWRYTSCPAHRTAGQGGVIIMAYVNAVRITKNPEHLRILRLAWEEKFQNYLANPLQPAPGVGKSYTSTMYGCPEAASLFAQLEDDSKR